LVETIDTLLTAGTLFFAVPHLLQKLSLSSLLAPQEEQVHPAAVGTTLVPHFGQNTASSSSLFPHL
jgi:hypothetical protein